MPLNLNSNVNIPRKKLNKPLVLKKMSNFWVIVPALSHADDAVAAFAQTAVVLKQSWFHYVNSYCPGLCRHLQLSVSHLACDVGFDRDSPKKFAWVAHH